ncbi:MAG: lipoyl(octanoyl) transferase LipB [Clostridiales bacterium]|nr:lipoyl(octanoyl) transferase LipB [Clostridiales bacterium]
MKLLYKDLGTVKYNQAYDLQEKYVEMVQNGSPDTLVLLEHPKVITLGINADVSNILMDTDDLIANGFEIMNIRRGGDVTYHGPGQLVAYTIFNIKKNHGGSIKIFVHALEQIIIDLLIEDYGIEANRDPINSGVFIGLSKIAAIGLSVHRGVTMHGFALNVNTDLSDFKTIAPCGLTTRDVTSMEAILGQSQNMVQIKKNVLNRFTQTFGFTSIET